MREENRNPNSAGNEPDRTPDVESGGGAYIGGDVDTGGGTFVGRDLITEDKKSYCGNRQQRREKSAAMKVQI